MRFGFNKFGRFSVNYKALFGENRSQTRRETSRLSKFESACKSPIREADISIVDRHSWASNL